MLILQKKINVTRLVIMVCCFFIAPAISANDDERFKEATLQVTQTKSLELRQQGVNTLIELAKRNHGGALNNLGYLFEHGIIVPKDTNKAFKLYLAAAEQGSIDGKYNAGKELIKRNGDERRRGYQLLESASKVHPWAAYLVAKHYLDDHDTGNDNEALQLLFFAAQKSDVRAMIQLADIYLNNKVIGMDLATAHAWLRVAFRHGASEAKTAASQIYAQMTGEQRRQAVAYELELVKTYYQSKMLPEDYRLLGEVSRSFSF